MDLEKRIDNAIANLLGDKDVRETINRVVSDFIAGPEFTAIVNERVKIYYEWNETELDKHIQAALKLPEIQKLIEAATQKALKDRLSDVRLNEDAYLVFGDED